MIIEEVEEKDIESRVDSDASDEDKENLNVRAAIVHMVGDMVQSIGVIAAALIIYLKPEWKIADPICTFLFSILVMFTTIPVFSDCMRILMESAPVDMDVLDVFYAILEVSFSYDVTELLLINFFMFSCHMSMRSMTSMFGVFRMGSQS